MQIHVRKSREEEEYTCDVILKHMNEMTYDKPMIMRNICNIYVMRNICSQNIYQTFINLTNS